jgi:type IV pilus assembly protein PilW
MTARKPRRAGQRGLSLVELMISLVIGLVILAALVTLFVNTSGGNRELARANSLIENGRLALELLGNDVVHAGYWGPYVPDFDDQTAEGVPIDAPTAVPDPCLAYTTPWSTTHKINLLHIPLVVYDANAIVCSTVLPDRQPGSDILVVRHAELCAAGVGTCEGDKPEKVYVQSSRCENDAAQFAFGRQAGPDPTAFNLRQRGCTNLAEKRKFISNIYYVRKYAVSLDDGIPTLMRSTFDVVGGIPAHTSPVALVHGVQAMRVELGVDNFSKAYAGQPNGTPVNYGEAVSWLDPETRTTPTNRGDGSPDGPFVTCTTADPCTVAELSNVTAAKITLLVRTREGVRNYTDTKTYRVGGAELVPFEDGFKRHVYVSTVRLPNIAGRRQTP